MRDQLVDLIVAVAKEQNLGIPRRVNTEQGAEALLYGTDSPLDSMGLVRFIVSLEAAIEEKFGVPVILADERAMSQRHSPFRTIGSLASYVEALLGEETGQANP